MFSFLLLFFLSSFFFFLKCLFLKGGDGFDKLLERAWKCPLKEKVWMMFSLEIVINY